MNKEVIIMVVIPITSFLFAMGGFRGKWWRRYILPIILGIGLILLGSVVWKCTLSCILLSAALHLGYGESKKYWYKFMVGCCYAIPSLWLGFTIWQLILPIMFTTLFALSNWKLSANEFKWKYIEILYGALIALCYIDAVL